MPLVTVEQNLVNGMDVVAAALRSAVEGKRYIEFSYVPQKRYKNTPSRLAARADTVYVGNDLSVVKGHLDEREGPIVFFAPTTQHWCLRLQPITRRVRTANGYYSGCHNATTGENFRQGEHLFRCYRLVGIDLASVMVGAGRRGKIRLFP